MDSQNGLFLKKKKKSMMLIHISIIKHENPYQSLYFSIKICTFRETTQLSHYWNTAILLLEQVLTCQSNTQVIIQTSSQKPNLL